MGRFVLFMLAAFQTASLFAQVIPADSSSVRQQTFYQKGKTSYNISLGSQFTSASGFGSGLSSWVAPVMYYNVSNRFRIGVGLDVTTTQYFDARPWYTPEANAGTSGNFVTGAINVTGQYLVSDRLTLSGSMFKIFPVTKDPLPYNPFNPVSRNGAQGASFNVDYKVSDHVHIQAGFRYSEGINPWSPGAMYNDPFHQGSYAPGYATGRSGW